MLDIVKATATGCALGVAIGLGLAFVAISLGLGLRYVWDNVVTTELEFMAQHPVPTIVGAVVLGLLAFAGYRVSAR